MDTSPHPKITVIDSLMGSGKTSWAIKQLKAQAGRQLFDESAPKYIYI